MVTGRLAVGKAGQTESLQHTHSLATSLLQLLMRYNIPSCPPFSFILLHTQVLRLSPESLFNMQTSLCTVKLEWGFYTISRTAGFTSVFDSVVHAFGFVIHVIVGFLLSKWNEGTKMHPEGVVNYAEWMAMMR